MLGLRLMLGFEIGLDLEFVFRLALKLAFGFTLGSGLGVEKVVCLG